MKKWSVIFLATVAAFTVLICLRSSGSDKVEMYIHENLPPQFADMTNEDVLPGLFPAAVYEFRNGLLRFGCVGSVFKSGTNEISVILPEHVFSTNNGPGAAYAIRIARPDSHKIDGFVGKIEMTSTDLYGCDIVIAQLVSEPAVITNFSKITDDTGIVIGYSQSLNIRKKEVRRLRSVISGKYFDVIGCGLQKTKQLETIATNALNIGKIIQIDDDHPLVAIEETAMSGRSGSPYIDDNKRIFIIHSGLDYGGSRRKEEEAVFMRLFHRPLKGMTLVSGPVWLDPQ